MSISKANPPWSGPDSSYDSMPTVAEDEFSNFLDFENIDYNNIPILDGSGFDPTNGQDTPAHSGFVGGDADKFAPFHTLDNGTPDSTPLMEHGHNQRHHQHMACAGIDHRDYGTYQQQQQQGDVYRWPRYQPNMSVPPTPNSSEMYPAQYLQQLDSQDGFAGQQLGYDMKAAQMAAFTPLTSPQFSGSAQMPTYAMPGSTPLSSLTSPALYPQQGSMQGSTSVQSLTAESSLAGSPIDFDHDNSGDRSMDERPRKSRRKEPTKSPKPASGSRRRKPSTVTRTASKSSTRNRPQDDPVRASPANSSIPGELASQPASVSPPDQSSALMRPPPKPLSAKSTPALNARNHAGEGTGKPPATPSSLMQLPRQPHPGSAGPSPLQSVRSSTTDGIGQGMEELTLPEAATHTELPTRSAASRNGQVQPTSARSTPALLPRIASNGHHYVQSPPAIPYGNTSKNPTGRGGSRKRNSVSSNLISPALRPRISPNIQPLMSDGRQQTGANQMSDETHALLLASKSNYQNILEGNHLPGVNYPSELSTNLTSKRTSHKIAEQGRRNRINTALQTMQSLLPASPSLDGTSSDCIEAAATKTPATPAQAANSKAATVEHAIEYIKVLKTTTAEKESEIERMRVAMAELEKKLGERDGEDVLLPAKSMSHGKNIKK